MNTTKTQKVQGELIMGVHPVIEVLKAKRRKVISIYTTRPEPKAWADIAKLLPARGVAIQYVTREVLTKMMDSTDHQGVVAWVQPFAYRNKPFDAERSPFLVMLDGIQDVRNLGAIIRSAYCAGADGVVLTKRGAAPMNAAAIKASAGLAEHMEIMVASSSQEAVNQLKKAGYNLYMAVFKGENALECAYKGPLCLVIGSEGVGIAPGIVAAGTAVTLPQRSRDISYNASVAAGILLCTMGTKLGKI